MKIKSANGKKCYLIHTGEEYLIRIYAENYAFKDYAIAHSDLGFVIEDEDAYLIEVGINRWIDHKPLAYEERSDIRFAHETIAQLQKALQLCGDVIRHHGTDEQKTEATLALNQASRTLMIDD